MVEWLRDSFVGEIFYISSDGQCVIRFDTATRIYNVWIDEVHVASVKSLATAKRVYERGLNK